MPIYAYKCDSCGHTLELLQKMSDSPARDCPSCGAATLVKQVTAAGFQLKGSGWYVTDFRGGQSAKSAPDKAAESGADELAGKAGEPSGSSPPAEVSAPKASENSSGSSSAAPAPSGGSAEVKSVPAVKSGPTGQ